MREALEEAIVTRDDGSLLIAGWLPVDELAESLGVTLPEKRPYETAAGMLVNAFGKLPAVGERIAVQNWQFEIIDLDGRRIDKVLAIKRPTARQKMNFEQR